MKMERVKNILKITGLSLFILECIAGIVFCVVLSRGVHEVLTQNNMNRFFNVIETQQQLEKQKMETVLQ